MRRKAGAQRISCLKHQIAFVARQAVPERTRHFELIDRRAFHANLVSKVRKYNETIEQMIPIIPAPGNMQRQIDLGGGDQADRTLYAVQH
ncbi:MAG TPA: hypothetical protein VK602_11380 [Phyllobacterium sp.]|nr:hypothetical protein [Phyllobacterium sp.]